MDVTERVLLLKADSHATGLSGSRKRRFDARLESRHVSSGVLGVGGRSATCK
jgi:hypothetical protein